MLNGEHNNISPEQKAIIVKKIELWEGRITGNQVIEIEFCNEDYGTVPLYPPGIEYSPDAEWLFTPEETPLARTSDCESDPTTGMPTEAKIGFNSNPSCKWHWSTAEPVPGDKFDGWTVVNHELCHALGFSAIYFDNFAAHVTPGPGNKRTFRFFDGRTATLTPSADGTHMDSPSHPGDMMENNLPKGTRRKCRDLDIAILLDAHGFGNCLTNECSGSECDMTFKSCRNPQTCRITNYMHNNNWWYNSCFVVEGKGISFSAKNLANGTTQKNSRCGVIEDEIVEGKLCCGDDISKVATCKTCTEEEYTVNYYRAKKLGSKTGLKVVSGGCSSGAAKNVHYRSFVSGEPGDYTITYSMTNMGLLPVVVTWHDTPFNSQFIMPSDSVASTIAAPDTTVVHSVIECDTGRVVCLASTIVIDQEFCVCMDSTSVLPGHNATIRLTWNNMPEMGGFDFLVCYDPSGLNFLSAKPLGEVAEWEYFTYRYSHQDNCGGGCPTGYIRLIGIADMPDGETPHEGVFTPEDGHFAELTFGTIEDYEFIGQCFHLNYCWLDCGDNTISSKSGDTLYMAVDIINILPDSECLAEDKGYMPVISLHFCHGIVCIVPPPDERGDINLNGVATEISDAVLFANYFIYGPGVWDPIYYENQIMATDINNDGIVLTVADLVYLIRIITGDANPYPESGEGGKITPDHLMAAVDWRTAGDQLTIDFITEADAGAILLAFDHHGAEFGEPVLGEHSKAMTIISHNNGAQLRVLLYGLESGASIPAGEGRILTIPITTQDPGLVLAEVEAADYYGNMMTVETTRPTYVPKEFALFQNIPNPFNATTRIDFNLPEAGEVTLIVYDILGRKVATLVEDHLEPGAHHITWNSRDEYGAEVASGVYFYRITTDKQQASRKMVLVK